MAAAVAAVSTVANVADPYGAGVLATAVLGVLAVSAGPVALVVLRPPSRWQHRTLTGAGLLFLVGLALRSLPATGPVPSWLLDSADGWSIAGYVVLAGAVYGLISPAGRRDRAAALDSAAVGLAGALAVWEVVVNPALSSHAHLALSRFADAFCPMADVLILFLITRVYMARASRPRALTYLTVGLGLMLAGDVGFYVRATDFVKLPENLVLALFPLAYVALALGSLQPDIVDVVDPAAQYAPAPPHSKRRLVVVLVAMAVPVAVLLTWPAVNWRVTVVAGALALAQTATTFARLSLTVRALAAEQEEAHRVARLDAPTGLGNRLALLEHLHEHPDATLVLTQGLGLALIGDSWGPMVADQARQRLATALVNAAGPDAVVTHLDGDTFAVVPSPGHPAAAFAAQLAATVTDSVEVNGVGSLRVGLAAGVAGPAPTADKLLRNASLALRAARRRGHGTVVEYEPDLHHAARRRIEIVEHLRRAPDRGELTVAYQPLYATATRSLAGFEALARWTSHDLGPVSPAEFIPVAEDTGLIVDLGAWVLRQACEQLAALRRLPGLEHVHMAVNLAPRQLLDPGLVPMVAAVVATMQAPASALWLEVTESAVMSSPQEAAAVLRHLKALGVVLALDDFGTGFSSLAHLSLFPVDVLKVDRAFVSQLGTPAREAQIAAASIELAHTMGMSVVAEGVETGEQVGVLHNLGCDLLQGFLLGRPTPAPQHAPYGYGPGPARTPSLVGTGR